MKKYCKALVNLAVAFLILIGIVWLLPKMLVFLAPFVAGWIIALIAGPLVRFFEEKIKLKRKIGGAFVIIAVIALVVLVIYIVCAQLFEQVRGLASSLPEMFQKMEEDFISIGNNLNQLLSRLPGNIHLNLNGNGIKFAHHRSGGKSGKTAAVYLYRHDYGAALFLFFRSGEAAGERMVSQAYAGGGSAALPYDSGESGEVGGRLSEGAA